MKNNNVTILILCFTMILIAINLLLTQINQRTEFGKINNKIDAIASESDAIASELDAVKEQNENYESNIEELNTILDNLEKNIDDEIFRLDEKIDEVEIAKEEVKKTYVAAAAPTTTYVQNTDGLTASSGVNYYGDQKETYYNLNMGRVVVNAQNAGIEGEYWVREDGAKMLGDYVIVAANQDVYSYGSTVETSLGTGIVLDTGEFAVNNPTQVDIATDW